MKRPKHLDESWPESVNEVLTAAHLVDLRRSGLSDQTILEARIYSVSADEAKRLLNRKSEVGPGYVIPYPSAKGFLEKELNFKPDTPLPSLKKRRER